MRILFTADIHLKLGQKNIPKDWARARYSEFFLQVYALEDEVDTHIIGGDIFDRVPTIEELELYFDFISRCKIPTIIYDGNHEATKKGFTFLSNLKEVTEKINPLVRIVDESMETPEFSILPYCDLHKKNSIEVLNKTKPVFTHVRGDIEPHVHAEVDLERFKEFPIIFAGDLHSNSNCQRNIVYPGSPMTISFHRNKVSTGYIIIEDNWEWSFGEFRLPQLLRKTVSSSEDIIPGVYDHVIYEAEGDLDDLSKIKNSDLLDKKIVKRQTEASLLLSKGMPIEEELSEYLLYILEFPDEKVSNILRTFNDYT